MKNLYFTTIVIFAISINGFSQVYNRSFADNFSNEQPIIESYFNNTLLVSTNQDNGMVIRLINMQGDVIDSTVFTGFYDSWMFGGIKVLQDSSALIFGRYDKGCDVLMENGDFVLHLSPGLDTIQFKKFRSAEYDFYDIMELPNKDLIGIGTAGLLKLNSNLDSIDSKLNPGLLNTGAAYLGNGELLTGTKTWSSSNYSWEKLDVNTFSVSPLTAIHDGDLYDLTDSTFGVWNNSNQILHYLRKSDFSSKAQVNFSNAGMFSPELYFHTTSMAAVKGNRYKIYDLENNIPLDSGSFYTTTSYKRGRSAAILNDSVFQMTTRSKGRQIHQESFVLNKPKSDKWPAGIKVRNTGFEVLNIDTFPDNSMTLSFNSDWEVTIVNQSAKVIRNLSFYHSVYPNLWMCLPQDTIVHLKGLSLVPGDSIKINLMDVESNNQRLLSSTLNVYFNVRIAQINGHIVSAGTDSVIVHTVNNVDLAENEISGFSMYPNPANDFLMLYTPGKDMSIRIYDSRGKKLHEISLAEEGLNRLDISELPAGIYLVELKGAGFKGYQKLMKQ